MADDETDAFLVVVVGRTKASAVENDDDKAKNANRICWWDVDMMIVLSMTFGCHG